MSSGVLWFHYGEATEPLVGDLNDDGIVTVGDLLILLAAWGACADPCPADLNSDGEVNVGDMLLLLNNWG